MTDILAETTLVEKLAAEFGFEVNDRAEFDRILKEWDEDFRPFATAVRDSEVVSEKDLAIRINVRDYD